MAVTLLTTHKKPPRSNGAVYHFKLCCGGVVDYELADRGDGIHTLCADDEVYVGTCGKLLSGGNLLCNVCGMLVTCEAEHIPPVVHILSDMYVHNRAA